MIPEKDMEKLIAFYHLFNVSTQFQVVEMQEGMLVIINSNENGGHNKGHVHIESGGAEVEIDLQTFEIMNMSGKMNKHKLKSARKFVEENKQLFIDYWNDFSNGVSILI